jgi:hypothetical protein
MKNKFCLLIFFFSFHFLEAQQDNDRQDSYAQEVKKNGVIITTDITKMPYTDVQKIVKYNFDSYRAYKTRQKVQLKNGPVAELESIDERLKEHVVIDSEIIAKKKSIAGTSYKYEVVPLLDILLGYKAPLKQKEKTSIFMIPKDNN